VAVEPGLEREALDRSRPGCRGVRRELGEDSLDGVS
jgi:hypothetical protein